MPYIDVLAKILRAFAGTSFHPLPEDVVTFVRNTRVLPIQDDETRVCVDLIFSFGPYEHVAIQRSRSIRFKGVDVNFASPEDIVIHKLVAGRPRDMEDAQSIVLQQKGLDVVYVTKWLKEFEPVVSRDLVSVFRSMGQH